MPDSKQLYQILPDTVRPAIQLCRGDRPRLCFIVAERQQWVWVQGSPLASKHAESTKSVGHSWRTEGRVWASQLESPAHTTHLPSHLCLLQRCGTFGWTYTFWQVLCQPHRWRSSCVWAPVFDDLKISSLLIWLEQSYCPCPEGYADLLNDKFLSWLYRWLFSKTQPTHSVLPSGDLSKGFVLKWTALWLVSISQELLCS